MYESTITWEDIYNNHALKQSILQWYSRYKVKLKERTNYYIDRRGNFVIEWDPSYVERYSVVKWSDLYQYFNDFFGITVEFGLLVNVIYLRSGCSISITKRDPIESSNMIIRTIFNYLLDSTTTMRDLKIDNIIEKTDI